MNPNIKSLTDKDIKNIFNNNIKVLLYSELYKYKNIDDLMKPFNKVIILYVFRETLEHSLQGHWVALKKEKNRIIFFDSFASIPDATIIKLPKEIKVKFKEDFNQLSKLLYNSKYELGYNSKTLQDNKSNLCGYYCVGYLSSDMNVDDFSNLFTNDKKSNDSLIYKLVVG